jgi:hypothetical protein
VFLVTASLFDELDVVELNLIDACVGIAVAPRNGDRGIEVTPDLHQPGSKSQEAPLLTNE